jgi:hypothetical protein
VGWEGREELAVVEGLVRVELLEGLLQLHQPSDRGAGALGQRLAEGGLLLAVEQLRAGWQPHGRALAAWGQVDLAVGEVGADEQVEHRHDAPPAFLEVGQQPAGHRVVEEGGRDGGGDGRAIGGARPADRARGGRCVGHGGPSVVVDDEDDARST